MELDPVSAQESSELHEGNLSVSIDDVLNRVQSVHDSDLTVLAEFAYVGAAMPSVTTLPQPNVQRTWKQLPADPAGDGGDPYTGYDRFGRTEWMRWVQPSGSSYNYLVNVQWGYDQASLRTWRKDLLAPAATNQDQAFAYDGLYQVSQRQKGLLNISATAVGGIPAQQENFAYDETGNWVSYQQANAGALGIDQTRVNNVSNQITQVDGTSAGVSYDKNGNMLLMPTLVDLTGPSDSLVWDAWNRLRKIAFATGGTEQYQYDGISRRTTNNQIRGQRDYYYDDQWRSVEEHIDEDVPAQLQHVWHPADRSEMLFRDQLSLSQRLYCMKDQLDPVAVCDTSGNVLERYAYTAFGLASYLNNAFVPESSNISHYDWYFVFHAEFVDIETGWMNYGYRYYVPSLGRWPSREPIGEHGDLNLYSAFRDLPTEFIDLIGLVPWKVSTDQNRKIDDKGRPIVNNCLGYGLTGKLNVFMEPQGPIPGYPNQNKTSFLQDITKGNKMKCMEVKTLSSCKCKCNEAKVVITLYANANPNNKGKNPWTDPSFDWTAMSAGSPATPTTPAIPSTLVTDVHTIRAESGCTNNFLNVPAMNQPLGPVDDSHAALFNGDSPMLCCCIPK